MSILSNAQSLQTALNYLAKSFQWRLTAYFGMAPSTDQTEVTTANLTLSKPPSLSDDWFTAEAPLVQFCHIHQLTRDELLVILIALAPHLQPDFFDQLIMTYLPQAGDYPQIGGWRGKSHRGFLPTGDTVLFILGAHQLGDRLQRQHLFAEEHILVQKRVLYLDAPADGEPRMSGKLIMTQDYIDWFSQGRMSRPHFSITFPAEAIATDMDWDDLVLTPKTLQQVQVLETWLQHHHTLEQWIAKRKRGYRVLFHGLPGTGKTLTASLLGKYTGRDVYKIDISMVVSKFIGETEKNLANLFARAENKNWILFFDEADALFGKRTTVKDAHDKYANQEVSYLLQRIENYNGLVILASNFKSNIDDAFMRRLDSVIYFPMPNSKERLSLWKKTLPQHIQIDSSLDLSEVSQTYELTGADIVNVVQFCCLQLLQKNTITLYRNDLVQAIKCEFAKSGKLL